MITFQHVRTDASGPVPYMTGLSDLLLDSSGTTTGLYSVSNSGLMFRTTPGLITLDSEAFAPSPALDAPRQLIDATLDGVPVLLSYGQFALSIAVLIPDATGAIAYTRSLALTGADVTAMSMLSLQVIEHDGQTFFVSSSRQTEGLQVWEQTAFGTLTARGQAAFAANDVLATAQLSIGGTPHILALSAGGNSLSLLRLGADGSLSQIDKIDQMDGLAIAAGTRLAVAEVAGATYALVGAAGSSSLSVVAIAPTGQLTVVDHVIDDLFSRFQSVSALATASLDGQTYIIAGGADDGLTLMTLLPGGRLLSLGTIADSLHMALADPSDIVMAARSGGLDIFVAGEIAAAPGEADHAISQLRVELGTIGATVRLPSGSNGFTGTSGRDQVVGSDQAETLSGGGGDDILFDGAGADTLWGGSGADVFVFALDGETDRIVDFEPGIDRLDLSLLGRFYTLNALDIAVESLGTRISFGDEDLLITTASGAPLTAADLDLGDLLDLWHVLITPLPLEDPLFAGNDWLRGTIGADTLLGGGGDDWLIGDGSLDAFDAHSGQIFRLYKATLDRAPDIAGLLHWVETLQNDGLPLADMAANFVGSPEFQATYGNTTNAEFVTLLYNNVLDRAPDPAGLAGWTAKLDSGDLTRPQVVVGFSESLEFLWNVRADALPYTETGVRAGFGDDVFRLYKATLDRAPDAAGFDYWTGLLADGRAYHSVIGGFVQSLEFQSQYGGLDDEAFVTLLYYNVLGRAPDPIGLEGWSSKLTSGVLTREQVVAGFAQSPEFTLMMAEPLRSWLASRGGGDTLNGGSGENILYGGYLSDTFIFNADTPGSNTVLDYEPWDKLRFDEFGYAAPGDVFAHMTQQGLDVVFDDQGTIVHLLNLALDTMSPDLIIV